MATTTTMSGISPLEGLQALHTDLITLCEHRFDNVDALQEALLAHAEAFKKLLGKPPRSNESRTTVKTGKIKIDDEEYSINNEFQEIALQLADELDLDEVETAKLLLDAQDDQLTLGRPLHECGVIRFHQQRKYLLNSMRLCIQLAQDEGLPDKLQEHFKVYVDNNIFGLPSPGETLPSAEKKVVPRCMAALQDIKAWLQKLSDRLTMVNVVYQGSAAGPPEYQEIVEFSHVSLVQQHELLAVIMCFAVEGQHTDKEEFKQFLKVLQKLDKYDPLLVHLFPTLGAYILQFGSMDGFCDVNQAKELHKIICKQSDDDSWTLPYLHAAVQGWWIIEYSGWFIDAGPGMSDLSEAEAETEEAERTKLFTEALKEGAFDFILSVAADVSTPEWQDPARLGIRKWLQRQSPTLISDFTQFSHDFQICLMRQLEVFVEGFISNLPDVLRKLRSEEDEQRQLSQNHEQDVDLERFLLIIAYAYEGRPDAAEAFWLDPDSNLAGFLHWASRRASTPLVTAFCEMLQSISEDEACATQAHRFLLDDGQHASGKMRRTLSLTWAQINRELVYFVTKLREKPLPPQSHLYRGGKPTADQAEVEPEFSTMLECYLRLVTKLSTESEAARQYLLGDDYHLLETFYTLISSPIPKRLRACAFYALKALASRKSRTECFKMWKLLEAWANGSQVVPPPSHTRQPVTVPQQSPADVMRNHLLGTGTDFEDSNAVVQYLVALVSPVEDLSPLNDTLPFPETLGAQTRMTGIDPYVDFVAGHVFTEVPKELPDMMQKDILRLSCVEFFFVGLNTFNDELIVIGNQSNIDVDAIISTTDLATYVRLHPFARIMEWMFNDKVLAALIDTVNSQNPAEIGSAAPDSPIIMSILRAVEVITKVLEMQDTYLHIVRPLIKTQLPRRRQPVANAAYTCFEDGIMNHLALVVNLGRYCGIGHPALTLACLRLLEKISASPKIASAWNPGRAGRTHRNKAIVALEADGEAKSIAASLTADLIVPLDAEREADLPNYMIKVHILDFLYECLEATPNQPTIAHLLLGFKCGLNALSIEADGDFDSGTSLFHNMLRVLLDTPSTDDQSVRRWLTDLKFKIMRILQILWKSPLSSSIVLDELRDTDFLCHVLIREFPITPQLTWDGHAQSEPDFLLSDSSLTFISFLALRAMTFEYASIELCAVSQSRLPNLKRRLFDALNGQLKCIDKEMIQINSVFDLFDFLPHDGLPRDITTPHFEHYRDLDLRTCLEEDADSNAIYNIEKVSEILLLKRSEYCGSGQMIQEELIALIDREEALLYEFLVFSNRSKQVASFRLRVLKSWVNILLVMFESNDFTGSTKVSFFLQALQAVLPSLEIYGSESPDEAFELAKLAKVLLFKIDFVANSPEESGSHTVGNLVSEKLFQLFQICLHAITRWAGNSELRAMYYSVCYRYLTGIIDEGQGFLPGRQKTVKSIQVYGERLLNVICDDAYGSDAACQTAALVLLGAFVNLGKVEEDTHVVATLNKLNFIGILVDSLKSLLQEWLEIIGTNNTEQELLWGTKLALLLNLCQTREGAKFVLHANLLRSIELSGLFAADPELEIDPSNTQALEKHYSLLVRVMRIIGAAILARGSNNVTQGRRFLMEHRMLTMQVLKRSAGISAGRMTPALQEKIEDLADAFMVLITATGFLEFEEQQAPSQTKRGPALYH